MNNRAIKIPEFKNVRDIINNAVKEFPNNNAFIIKIKKGKEASYRNISYQEFQEDINCIGTALIKLGLKNKRIAIIGKNSYDWAIGYYATLNGTGIVVPLDKGLPEEEIESCLARSKADAIIFDKSYEEKMINIKKRNKTVLKEYICMSKSDNSNFKNLQDLLILGKKELESGNKEFINAKIDNEKMSIILFTSGTTAISKAVMLSHKNIASNVYAIAEYEDIYSTDVNMAFLPFHHTFGCTGLLLFLGVGSTTVFCDGLRHISQNLKEYKVTVFFCVPLIIEAMHKKILEAIEKQGKIKLIKIMKKVTKFLLKFKIDIRRIVFKQIIDNLGGSIRFVISGAAAIDKQVAEDFNNFGILTVQGYGLTETSPVLSAENEKNIRYGSIGKEICNVEIKIDNPNEEGIGEIIAKGPNIMLGYYENEEATSEALKNGWFYTGDLGYKDKDGYIYICGRKKNVIVLKNGKNVYPEELEIVISSLPYVAENIVYGIPKNDDLVLATKIVYNKEYVENIYGEISNEELEKKIWQDIKNINTNLPNYKHIKKLIITDEPMKKTTTNKIKRHEENL